MRSMRDWYCGLGGASQPFFDHGWNVEIYDNYEPLHPHVAGLTLSRVQDVNQIELPQVDLEWFSPPCTEFSHGRVPQIENPDMTEFFWCLERIKKLAHNFWVLENVRGAIKHFHPYLGPPRQIIDTHICLWGNFPTFEMPKGWERPLKTEGDVWSDHPLRANFKAVIPYEVGNQLRLSILSHRSLEEFGVIVT